MTTPVSFEFFPPNTPEGSIKLRGVVEQLSVAKPEFYSVTYGAGGATREKTLATVLSIIELGQNAAPHLSCVGATRAEIGSVLSLYISKGINRLVALRGDLPSGMAQSGEFRYANELIEFIRAETGDHFHIEVACYPEVHPQSRYASQDMQNFLRKIKSGADSAITQFFFNPEAYFHFVDEARRQGLDTDAHPIIPGIMPFHNYSKIAQFSERDGIDIPRWVSRKMEGYMDDSASIRAFGLDVVTGLCERLIQGGAPAIHFYTLNQSALTLEICKRLGLA